MKESKNGFTFEKSDLDRFAESSHDTNPLHVCEGFAKTTIYGENVVFGMLGVTYMLDRLALYEEDLKVQFFRPMFLGRLYRYACAENPAGKTVSVLENGTAVLTIHSGNLRRSVPRISSGPVRTVAIDAVSDPPRYRR